MLFVVEGTGIEKEDIETVFTTVGLSYIEGDETNSIIADIYHIDQIEWLYREFNRKGYRLSPVIKVEIRK